MELYLRPAQAAAVTGQTEAQIKAAYKQNRFGQFMLPGIAGQLYKLSDLVPAFGLTAAQVLDAFGLGEGE